MQVIRDIEYAAAPGARLLLDIYRTEETSPASRPVVIYVHGGGWRGGDKTEVFGMRLLEHGFALVSINYRLTPQAAWPAQIHDAKAAVRWTRAEAGRYGFDPNRIGAWGGSAGGHLVALLGVTGDEPNFEGDLGPQGVSSRIQAVCNWCGPTDLTQLHTPDWRVREQAVIVEVVEALIGGPLAQRGEVARHASPATHVKPGCPPFFTMQGTHDEYISPMGARQFHDRLRACGNASELHLLEGAGHAFHTGDRERLACEFFRRLLGR